jgi:hypothetical protein
MDLCYFLMLPMYLLADPRSFAVATLLSIAASVVAFWLISRRGLRLGSGGLVVLIGAPIGWTVMACWELVWVFSEVTGDAIRVDLVMLSPLVWLLTLAQAVVLLRLRRRARRVQP